MTTATAALNDFYSDVNLALFEDAAQHVEAVARDAVEPGTALDVPADFIGMSVQAIFDAQDEHERDQAEHEQEMLTLHAWCDSNR